MDRYFRKTKSLRPAAGLLLITILLAGCGLIAAQRGIAPPGQNPNATAAVTATPTTTADGTIRMIGNVAYAQSESLQWKTTGVVSKVNVKVGDAVKKGAILAELSEDSLNATVLSAGNTLIEAQEAVVDLMKSETKKYQIYATLTTNEISYQATKQAQEALYYPRGTSLEIAMAYDAYQLALENFNYAKEDYRVVLDSYKGWDDDARKTYFESYSTTYSTLTSAYNKWQYLKGAPSDTELAYAQGAVLTAQRSFDELMDSFGSYASIPRQEDISPANVRVDSAETLYNRRYILAPFDGTITEIKTEPGQYVTSASSAFQLDDMSSYSIALNLSEVDLKKASRDECAAITFDAIPGKVYQGKVSQIDGAGTSTDAGVIFKMLVSISNPDSQVRSGMTALVVFGAETTPSTPAAPVQIETPAP